MKGAQGVFVQSVDRAVDILSLLSSSRNSELGITEIASKMKLNKSTVYGLVNTLVYRGYIEQNSENRRYCLGIKLFEMGSLVQRRMDVRNEARPYAQELSVKYDCTVHLAALYDFEAVYIDKLVSPDAVVQYSQLGRRAPLYCTGVGKALLANFSDERRQLFYQNVELKGFTARTITDKNTLEDELSKTRARGYALDNEEIQQGVCCVAAPIFNHQGCALAALSVSKPWNSMDDEQKEVMGRHIVNITNLISARLGYSGPAKGEGAEKFGDLLYNPVA
jgi:DNA-binding IclR family transcriptional regulator